MAINQKLTNKIIGSVRADRNLVEVKDELSVKIADRMKSKTAIRQALISIKENWLGGSIDQLINSNGHFSNPKNSNQCVIPKEVAEFIKLSLTSFLRKVRLKIFLV